MEIRKIVAPDDIAQAAFIDEALPGLTNSADHVVSVVEAGGLRLAIWKDKVKGFCCLDRRYFFEKPFVSLLMILPEARSLGSRCRKRQRLSGGSDAQKPLELRHASFIGNGGTAVLW